MISHAYCDRHRNRSVILRHNDKCPVIILRHWFHSHPAIHNYIIELRKIISVAFFKCQQLLRYRVEKREREREQEKRRHSRKENCVSLLHSHRKSLKFRDTWSQKRQLGGRAQVSEMLMMLSSLVSFRNRTQKMTDATFWMFPFKNGSVFVRAGTIIAISCVYIWAWVLSYLRRPDCHLHNDSHCFYSFDIFFASNCWTRASQSKIDTLTSLELNVLNWAPL